jgi:hypothetical protein
MFHLGTQRKMHDYDYGGNTPDRNNIKAWYDMILATACVYNTHWKFLCQSVRWEGETNPPCCPEKPDYIHSSSVQQTSRFHVRRRRKFSANGRTCSHTKCRLSKRWSRTIRQRQTTLLAWRIASIVSGFSSKHLCVLLRPRFTYSEMIMDINDNGYNGHKSSRLSIADPRHPYIQTLVFLIKIRDFLVLFSSRTL